MTLQRKYSCERKENIEKKKKKKKKKKEAKENRILEKIKFTFGLEGHIYEKIKFISV